MLGVFSLAVSICLLAVPVASAHNMIVDPSARTVMQRQSIAPVVGVRKVGIVLFNFQDNQSQPVTGEEVRSTVFDGAHSARAFYQDSSYGALDLQGVQAENGVGDVFGYLTLPVSSLDCGTGHQAKLLDWGTQVIAQLEGSGVDTSQYDYWVAVSPRSTCHDNLNWGMVWCNPTCVRMEFAWGGWGKTWWLHTHELGHIIGSAHSNSWTCPGNTVGKIGVLRVGSADCTSTEYGDPFTTMGRGGHAGSWDARRRYARGWLSPADVLTVTTSGTYRIASLNGPQVPARAMEIIRPDPQTGESQGSLWIEHRTSTGYDTWMSQWQSQGVQVRATQGSSTGYLLDTSPGMDLDTLAGFTAPGGDDSFLRPGRVLYDSSSGVLVRTISSDSTGATVHVTFGAADPTAAAALPTLAIQRVLSAGRLRALHVSAAAKDSERIVRISATANGKSVRVRRGRIPVRRLPSGRVHLRVTALDSLGRTSSKSITIRVP